jgi:acyl carrier protein
VPQLTQEISSDIRDLVIDRFLFGNPAVSLSNSESLLDRGIVDSTGVLELVMFLEEKFKIHVDDAELIPQNLESIDKTAAFVRRKLS